MFPSPFRGGLGW
ncbi:hypothetical protein VCHC72A2_00288A, partial [Vibrio cholerae HC-72A2]